MIRLALHDLTTMVGEQSSPQDASHQQLAGRQTDWLDEITRFTDNFYDPRNPASFSTFEKLYSTAKAQRGAEPGTVKAWLEQQDAYISLSENDSRGTHILLITFWTYGKLISYMCRL